MMYNKMTVFVLLSFGVICLSGFKPSPIPKTFQKQALKRIVIDAGHGGPSYLSGKFFGGSGPHCYEKDITLAVALKLQRVINEQIPDVEVIMTRTTDDFDSPIVKANKANAAKGDLFISLHTNDVAPIQHKEIIGYTTQTVKRKGKKVTKKVPEYRRWTTPNPAHGSETYIWGIGKNDEKEEAMRENDFIDTTNKVFKDFNPNDPAQILAISLRTEQYAERSRNLALTVEDEFEKSGRVSRGAKQRDEKGIWVLQATNMPAILIEMGFLSYPDEEAFLMSEEGQQQTAETITKAIKRYKFSLESKINKTNKTVGRK